ncbi:hypothetical protein [Duganella sp. HH105]|uniref:hypothetical protein n=1 Tax=Duganella sp. HH105 TaxID=1781067 RepID=UPI0008938B4B|nr:hypothetical protein [Duganella sp. HH105]OEZ58194.1 hypothetical protein DUGA6_41580 [Duganella sp. HH105]
MKNRLAQLIFLGFFQSTALAQSSLEPCREDFIDAYHVGVNKVIDDAVAAPSSLQLTAFPSFQAESGLRLVASRVYFVEFQTSFWGDSYVVDRKGNGRMDFTKPRTVAKSRNALLSLDTAQRIGRMYSKAITEATQSGRMGLDGTAYVLSTGKGDCAWAWSPEPNSQNGQLIELMRRLEAHTKFSSLMDLQRSEKSIIRLLNSIEGIGK